MLAHVALRAASVPGAAAVRALMPLADTQWIEAEHRRVSAVRLIMDSEAGWPSESIPDLAEALLRLRIEGLSWSATELLQGATLLRSSRRVRAALKDPARPAFSRAVLSNLAEQLVDLEARERAIEAAIAEDAVVRDDASPELRRIRRELRQTEGQLARLLQREMARLEPQHQAGDLSVTMRNGRWVIPIRREARALVGGIVHDSSGTGATLFVEPPAAVEFGNRVRELELDEQREVDRVLRQLTDELRPYAGPMKEAFDALVVLDSLQARGRYALEARCGNVEFSKPSEGLQIIAGRHPLLLAAGTPVVAFNLTLEVDERTLLVSGPNTGGKTVLLKAVGLLSMMAQAGIPVPVAEGTRLAVFSSIFADVGDEQSIEASLSTFSAHLKNLRDILDGADASSLVLVDELGSGTDPAEGAALGGAILETLTGRGVLTLATTHLGQLKLLASEVPGVVNASLQFDPVRLAPTYHLLKGIPGRSYGLSIARRLELDESVIARAEERLPAGERDLAVLLADVEAREAKLAENEQRHQHDLELLARRIATVADRETKARERDREAERDARSQARRYLLDARSEVERAIASVKTEGALMQAGFEEAARAARRSIEDAAAVQGAAVEEVKQQIERESRRDAQRKRVREAHNALGHSAAERDGRAAGSAARDGPLEVGDAVLVSTLGGKTGEIVSLRGNRARVQIGSIGMEVPVASLTRTTLPEPPAIRVNVSGLMPEADPVRELDLRGLRADGIDDRVLQALDAAVRNDLHELRIIHGKGTGALRSRVSAVLTRDTRVVGFRLGAWNEGGDGVTLAELG